MSKTPCGAFIGHSAFGFDWMRFHISECEECQKFYEEENRKFEAEQED